MTATGAVSGMTHDTSQPQSPAEVLVATGIEKSYPRGLWPLRRREPVLRGTDPSLHPGEVVGLVGENGSGKSTLMYLAFPSRVSPRGIDQPGLAMKVR